MKPFRVLGELIDAKGRQSHALGQASAGFIIQT
jgi:hypothetical protein